MDLSQLKTYFALGIILMIPICVNQVTVINLPQLFIINIIDKEIQHLRIAYLLHFFFVGGRWSLGCIDSVLFKLSCRNQSLVPTNKKIITVKIRPRNHCCNRNGTLHRENDRIDIRFKKILLQTFLYKSLSDFFLIDAYNLSNIGWMKTRISGYNSLSRNIIYFRVSVLNFREMV